jgi:GT2 family glycosyltransferase
MLLTISLVVTGDQPHLLPCLESIEAQTTIEHEIQLVAQLTSPSYLARVTQCFPQVKLIHNQELRGFAANHNQVLRRSDADFVLLLNDDTVILDHALDQMIEFLSSQPPEAGIVGCTNLDRDNNFAISCYPFPTGPVLIWRHSQLGRWLHGRGHERYLGPAHGEEPFKVDWVMASCMAIRRVVIEQVGYLDEDFFIYSEEVDYCFRSHKAGFSTYQVPRARIIHYESVTMDRFVPTRLSGLYLGNLYFLYKHGFNRDLKVVRAWYVVELLAKSLIRSLGVLAGRPPDARKRLSTYLDLIGICMTYRGQPPVQFLRRD